MSSSTETLTAPLLAKGVYSRSTASDLRGPCPVVNCLANHGYLPRDGRNVRVSDFTAAMNEVGLSTVLGAIFSHPIFLEHKQPSPTETPQDQSVLGRIWYLVRNPWAILFSAFGMRNPGQTDSMGVECLNLNQLALPGVVEHDVSLSRRDHQQGDNISPQPDLVEDLLASSSDGGKSITADDLAALRRRRITKQTEVNPGLVYGKREHHLACAEISLILKVFGDGEKIPYEYVRAVFHEERLPLKEGWKKRSWWPLGFLELGRTINKVKDLIGLDF